MSTNFTFSIARPAAAALLGASAALAQTTYTVTDVGNLPGGAYVYPSALNEFGDATGVSSSSTNSRAFLYTDAGGLQDLGALTGASGSSGSDVNELGEVVGQSGASAFGWSAGAGMQNLMPGVEAHAFATNNLGEVVGYMRPTPTAQETPFLLSNGTVTQITGGAYGWALDVNENGVVIGTWGGLGGSTWDANSGSRPIPVLPGYPYNNLGAINDRGVVAGQAWSSSGTGAWFRYTPGAGIVNLGSVAQGAVSDVNNRGDVVGNSGGRRARAWLYTDQNGFQDLNGLIPSSSGWVLVDAVAINDARQILCEAVGGPTCCRRTVRLDPVVPPSFGTFGTGCAGSAGTPALAAAPGALPVAGQTFTTLVTDVPATAQVFGMIGFSSPPSPLDLGVIGMGGCLLYTDIVAARALPNAAGTASFALPLPGSTVVLGTVFYEQAFVVDPGSNALGATVSNAGTGRIGQ